MTDAPLPETWEAYCARMYAQDPHGISAESREVDDAIRAYWYVGMHWEDGTPVEGCLYFNFGAAKKVSRKYGFQLREVNVANHARLKALTDEGKEEPFARRKA